MSRWGPVASSPECAKQFWMWRSNPSCGSPWQAGVLGTFSPGQHARNKIRRLRDKKSGCCPAVLITSKPPARSRPTALLHRPSLFHPQHSRVFISAHMLEIIVHVLELYFQDDFPQMVNPPPSARGPHSLVEGASRRTAKLRSFDKLSSSSG